MIAGIGVDSVEIARIEALWQRGGERFLTRIFTPAEQRYCLARHRPGESLAARFAAKEAVMKCLGLGWTEGLTFVEIEVERAPNGAVGVRLHGAAAGRAAALAIARVHVSLTHTAELATAFAVAER
ncbi:MAG: holo-ACP synthase [Planctomycetes bacterium]|nr:holo-ACP synthase [Planctomycetota bacterium]